MRLNYILGVLLGLWVLFAVGASGASPMEPTCNDTDTEHVSYDFQTAIIFSELIVTFKRYYVKATRKKYITAALKTSTVSIYYTTQYNCISVCRESNIIT